MNISHPENTVQFRNLPRRSKRISGLEHIDRFDDINFIFSCIYNITPRSFEEALNSPHKEKWLTAIQEELKNIEKNGTWEEPKLSINSKEI